MLVKRIAACLLIYLQPFTSYRDIGRKLQLFPTTLHLTPPLEFREKVWSSEVKTVWR